MDVDAPYGIAPPAYRLPEGTRLGPVRLQVGDLGRSEVFYAKVLGLVRSNASAGRSWLGPAGGAEPLIELVEHRGAVGLTPRSRLGLFHFALLVPDRAALGRLARHLGDIGLEIGMADHLVSEALYLSDPDGLGIEVYADRPRSRWRVRGRQLVMTTEPLDLDDLLAQAPDAPFSGLPSGTIMGHVHFHVGDLETAARFYHGALGFDKTVWDYPGALFLSAGGYHHHVGTNTWAAGARPAGPDDASLLSWTLVLPEASDVEHIAARVASAGYPVRPSATAAGLLVQDPWNIAVGVIAAAEPPVDGASATPDG